MSAASYRVVLRDLEQRRAVLAASLEQTESAIAALTALVGDDDDAEADTPAPAPKARPARPTPASSGSDLRGRILAALAGGPLPVSAVAKAAGIDVSAASYRLRMLANEGHVVREGKTSQTTYRRA